MKTVVFIYLVEYCPAVNYKIIYIYYLIGLHLIGLPLFNRSTFSNMENSQKS